MRNRVALLRGINVGGHRRVPMADLRALCPALGFDYFATYIQSGNLVFASSLAPPAAARRLEEALAQRFGFPVDVVVRTAAQWETYARNCPFAAANGKEPERVMLLLCRQSPNADAVDVLRTHAAAGEQIARQGDAVWIHYPSGIGTSRLSPARLDLALGAPATARNGKTVVALRALLQEAR